MPKNSSKVEKPLTWKSKEKRVFTTVEVLDTHLQDFKKILEDTDFNNKKEIEKLENYIIEEKIKFPILKDFPPTIRHYGISNIFEETCN